MRGRRRCKFKSSGIAELKPEVPGFGKTVLKVLLDKSAQNEQEFNIIHQLEERRNKLNHSEYDLTTWAARTWTSYMCQKVSVALHRAIPRLRSRS